MFLIWFELCISFAEASKRPDMKHLKSGSSPEALMGYHSIMLELLLTDQCHSEWTGFELCFEPFEEK